MELSDSEREDLPQSHDEGGKAKIPDKENNVKEDNEVAIVRKKRRGKPRGLDLAAKRMNEAQKLFIPEKTRRRSGEASSTPHAPTPPAPTPPAPTPPAPTPPAPTPPVSPIPYPSPSASATTSAPRLGVRGTTSRPNLYLLEQHPIKTIGSTKILKTSPVLALTFNFLMEDPDLAKHPNPLTLITKAAAIRTSNKSIFVVKSVWRHHFRMRLIDGQEGEGEDVNKESMMIVRDTNFNDSRCQRSLDQR
jgi:hypothetical protein